jgi:hypothetical protein
MLRQHLRNRRRQRRLAMIDMPNRPDVYVRLAAIKFFLAHDCSLSSRNRNSAAKCIAGITQP